jgi:proteasome lid subunit RPN8/RPN11
MNKLINNVRKQNAVPTVPPLRIRKDLLCQIMRTIGALAPESGGILLGPVGSNDITDFFFDSGGRCTGGTYSPDHVTLQCMMRDEWLPAGIDFKGFVHSHPGGFDRLSAGDLRYIHRLLEKNPDMSGFAAPIVIPQQFRIRAWVVLRTQPTIARPTCFKLI